MLHPSGADRAGYHRSRPRLNPATVTDLLGGESENAITAEFSMAIRRSNHPSTYRETTGPPPHRGPVAVSTLGALKAQNPAFSARHIGKLLPEGHIAFLFPKTRNFSGPRLNIDNLIFAESRPCSCPPGNSPAAPSRSVLHRVIHDRRIRHP